MHRHKTHRFLFSLNNQITFNELVQSILYDKGHNVINVSLQ